MYFLFRYDGHGGDDVSRALADDVQGLHVRLAGNEGHLVKLVKLVKKKMEY